MTDQAVFDADLDKFNTAFREMGALVVEDGEVIGIDPTVAPAAMLDSYSRLTQYGIVNGLL